MPYQAHGQHWHTEAEKQAKLDRGERYPDIFAENFDADQYLEDLNVWYRDLSQSHIDTKQVA